MVLGLPGDLRVLGAAAETSCGRPPVLEATRRLWDGISSPGSTAVYFCEDGFYEAGGQNQSVCGENGRWTRPTLSCQGNSANPTMNCQKSTYFHSTLKSFHFPNCLLYYFLWQRSHVGTLQHCPMLGRCGTAPPPLGARSLITVSGGFIPAENTTSRCAQSMVCGPTSPSPVKVPLFPPTCSRPPVSLSPPTCPTCSFSPPECVFFLPAALGCGVPPPLPNAVPLWDGDSTVGSLVVYRCTWGFRSLANVSVCTAAGKWDVASVLCKGVVPQSARRHFPPPSVGHMTACDLNINGSCSEPLAITNASMLWDGTAVAGSRVFYLCRLERSRGSYGTMGRC